MNFLAPDILAEARGLSPPLAGAGLAIGLFLWLLGARTHRFWLALVMTLTAGLLGLSYGPAYGMQPLVAGLLLAVAAGALSLALVRLLAFVAGGLAALGALQVVAPAWDEPLVLFLAGGLVGILLYRFWITALASLTGTLLMAYSGLCLLDQFGKIDTVAWATRNAPLANWSCAALAVLGVLVQFLLERRRKRKSRQEEPEEEEPAPKKPPRAAKKTWWHRMTQPARKAG